MELTVIRASVLLQNCQPDYVTIETTLPDPCWPYTDHLCLSFRVATPIGGADYVRIHFNIEPEVIDARYERTKFSGSG